MRLSEREAFEGTLEHWDRCVAAIRALTEAPKAGDIRVLIDDIEVFSEGKLFGEGLSDEDREAILVACRKVAISELKDWMGSLQREFAVTIDEYHGLPDDVADELLGPGRRDTDWRTRYT
jgi:hypothetical protein